MINNRPEPGKSPDLLLATLSPAFSMSEVADLLAPIGMDAWESLVQRANRHRVGSLLLDRLTPLVSAGRVPEKVERTLVAMRETDAKRLHRMYSEVRGILSGLRSAGVKVILLKGAYLADAVYDAPELRSMRDIDVLVPASASDAVTCLLRQRGYRQENASPLLVRLYALDSHLVPFENEEEVRVEVHWSIEGRAAPDGGAEVRPHPIDMDELWDRACPAVVHGHQILSLSPEDLILHLCLHAAFHSGLYVGLQSLCDVALSLRTVARHLRWEALFSEAERCRATKYVYLMLRSTWMFDPASAPLDIPAPAAWTERDEDILAEVFDYVIRYPRMGTREFARRREAIDAWWRSVCGVEKRAMGTVLA